MHSNTLSNIVINIKNKRVIFILLNLFVVCLIPAFSMQGCTKKEDVFNIDTPVKVEYKASGIKDGLVTIYFSGKKGLMKSVYNDNGRKITVTSYNNGGDTLYAVSEVMSMKVGKKMLKKDLKEGVIDLVSYQEMLKTCVKTGEEEIIGRKCEIFKDNAGVYTISFYNKIIPLKIIQNSNKMTYTATDIELNTKVSDSMFNPPADVNFPEIK